MKTFKKICALLALDVIAFTDGKCTLTEEQVQALENGLADKDALNDSLTEKSDALAKLQKDFDVQATALETKSSELSAKESLLEAKNSEISAKETLIASKDAEIDSLRAQVEALRKAPADDTSHVVDVKNPAEEPTDEARFINEMNEAKRLYNSVRD